MKLEKEVDKIFDDMEKKMQKEVSDAFDSMTRNVIIIALVVVVSWFAFVYFTFN